MFFAYILLLACLRLANAVIDGTTYDEMKYLAHHAIGDAYSLLNCTNPEGTTKTATWTTGVKGYLALDRQRKWIIVVFRGSFDAEDFETDGKKTLVPYTVKGSEGCRNCTVHQGIQEKWTQSVDTVLAAIQSARQANPNYKIYVTGHSLGGSYTGFAGVTIARTFGVGNVTGYSFAAFRDGDPNYAAYQEASFPGKTYYRVTSLDDNVPAAATTIQEGYRHGGTEYWIMKEPDPAATDIKVCNGSEDTTCNSGQVGANVPGINAAHLTYFVPILTANCTATPASK